MRTERQFVKTCHAEYIKLPRPLLQKPTDLDLHCLLKRAGCV